MSAQIINQAGPNKPLTQVTAVVTDGLVPDGSNAFVLGLLQLVQGRGCQLDQRPRCRVGTEGPRQLRLPWLWYVAFFSLHVPPMRPFVSPVDTDQTRHMHKDILKHQEQNVPLRRFAEVGL